MGSNNSKEDQLRCACENGELVEVKRLVDEGADVDSKNEYGWTPLMAAAARSGNFDIVRFLIDRGADIDIKSNAGYTALNCAAHHGHGKAARLLIERGANPHMKNNNGRTPLDNAKRRNNPSTAAIIEAAMKKEEASNINSTITEGIQNLKITNDKKAGKGVIILQDFETKAAKILVTINETIHCQEEEEASLQASHDEAINDAISKLSKGNNTRAATRSMKMAKLYKLEQEKLGRAIEMMYTQTVQVKSTLNSARVIGKMKPAAQSSRQDSTSSPHKSMDTIMKELHHTDYYAQQVQQVLSETVQVPQQDEKDLLLELQEIMASESISSPPATVPYSAASYQVPTAPSMDPNDVVVEAELVQE